MWTSSLRLRGGVLGTGACLAAFACAANGWAAGGTPMPAPDDPPPAYQTSTVKTSASTTAPTAPRAKRVAESAPAVPTPDAPLAASSTTTSKSPTANQAAVPAPDPSPGAASPSSTRSAPTSRRASAGGTTRVTTPAPRSAFTPPRSAQKQKAKPKPQPQPKTAVTKAKRTVAPPEARPRDAVRLGLPVGALAARSPGGDGMEGGLLVAAALLLAAAAGGSLLLGVAARTATRHA